MQHTERETHTTVCAMAGFCGQSLQKPISSRACKQLLITKTLGCFSFFSDHTDGGRSGRHSSGCTEDGGAPHSKDDLVMHIIAPLKWRESVMMLLHSVHNEHIKVIAILTLALSINPMWPLKVISSRPSFNSYNKF